MPLTPEHISSLQPYKPGKPISEVQRKYGLKKIIKLASNENPMGPSPAIIQAMKKSLNEISRYPDPGSYDLRQKLAERFDLKIDNIITGHGSEGIMSVIMRTFLCDDEEVITADATFIGFMVLAYSRGTKIVKVPLKNWRFDLEAIANAVTDKTKVIYLANPNNPTGTIFTVHEFKSFMEKIPEHVLIIMDEAYFEFARDDPKYPDSMKYRIDNVITLRTFSKAYGLAGIRIGYGFAHDRLIKNLIKVKLPFEPSIPAQAAGLAALDEYEYLRQYMELNKKGKKYLGKLFDKLGIKHIPSHANFITIVCESEKYALDVTQRLCEKGIIVRSLSSFNLPHCIRITIGLPEENEYLAEVLPKVV